MTIRAAILALSPSIYWPMDEPAGPTAFDASGSGNNGQYQPNTVFNIPGPETGTSAIASPVAAAGVVRNGNPVFGGVAKSMLVWASIQAEPLVGRGVTLYEGDPSATGIGISTNTAVPKTVWLFDTFFAADTGRDPTTNTWQQWAFTWSPAAGGTSTFQLDLGAVATLVGHSPHPSLAGDPIFATTPGSASLAHFAMFNYTLSNAQVQSVPLAAVGLQSATTLTGRAATDFDIASVGTLLDQIYAAVHRTY